MGTGFSCLRKDSLGFMVDPTSPSSHPIAFAPCSGRLSDEALTMFATMPARIASANSGQATDHGGQIGGDSDKFLWVRDGETGLMTRRKPLAECFLAIMVSRGAIAPQGPGVASVRGALARAGAVPTTSPRRPTGTRSAGPTACPNFHHRPIGCPAARARDNTTAPGRAGLPRDAVKTGHEFQSSWVSGITFAAIELA